MILQTTDYLHIRTGQASQLAPSSDILKPNTSFSVSYKIQGTNINGNNWWLTDGSGNYYWSGAVTAPAGTDWNTLPVYIPAAPAVALTAAITPVPALPTTQVPATDIFFDMHLHPSLKATLTGSDLTSWDEITMDMGPLLNPLVASFEVVINSQSNLSMMQDGNIHFAVAALHSIEQGFTKNLLIEDVIPAFSALDKDLLKQVRDGEISSFYVLNLDLKQLTSSLAINGKPRVNLLNKISDYDSTCMNLILSIEGSHCFNDGFKTGGVPPPINAPVTQDEISHYVNNFIALKQQGYRFLYLTLTHLNNQRPCNFCYGVCVEAGFITLIGAGADFKPAGNGITDLGKAIIKEAYAPTVGARTLIDIKHMSLVARQQLYELRNSNNWNAIPIMASHAGVTWTSFKTIKLLSGGKVTGDDNFNGVDFNYTKVSYYRPVGLSMLLFNPWSINLYNEDIFEILSSNGMIGVSLDTRIVGHDHVADEFFSTAEIASLNFTECPQNPDVTQFVNPTNDSDNITDPRIKPYPLDKDIRGSYWHVANNILHIVKYGLQNGFDGNTAGKPDVWKCICIGSDLDGLIDPTAIAEYNKRASIMDYPGLKLSLVAVIGQLINHDSFLNLNIPTHTIPQLVNNIMYQNGVDFLKKNFT